MPHTHTSIYLVSNDYTEAAETFTEPLFIHRISDLEHDTMWSETNTIRCILDRAPMGCTDQGTNISRQNASQIMNRLEMMRSAELACSRPRTFNEVVFFRSVKYRWREPEAGNGHQERYL
ncbi:unnamed protein product [Somion occarium]|uniref:Uncharacterized protein n=1 Tax=Somion occarium TaxID=3059160 RepID=A0ABP1DW26_9APHY